MSSVYHIVDKVPATIGEDMQIEYEELAQNLIKSGRVRIDTDYESNFVRFSDPEFNISLMLSIEELTDQDIIPYTKEMFRPLYGKRLSDKAFDAKISQIFNKLKQDLNKLVPVHIETKIKLVRLLVQSAHPIVIRWLLHDRVEVFITYSHNIGDMMDIPGWQQSGSNSGMQSTDGKTAAVFVSCGGNPFGENSKDHPTYGDGWAAVARLQIIAGQELGHFADIKRNAQGQQITRHSANFSGTKATQHVRIGRINDIESCNKLSSELMNAGMDKLIIYEKELKFYHTNKIGGLRVLWTKLKSLLYKYKLLKYVKNHKHLVFVRKFLTDKYLGLMIQTMIEDMKFNLSPVADVYKRANKDEEEAIACIEALARVPQQVMKWGHLATMITMKNLHKVYYSQVIPSLITNYSAMTGKQYVRNYNNPKRSFLRKLNIFLKKEDTLIPVRDI